jgi:regulator of protease activity HflC (stomatin/prohibitin superfamily)
MDVVVIAAVLLLAGILLWLCRDMAGPRVVYPWEAGLLYVNGRHEETLGAGRHWLWHPFAKVEMHRLRIRDQWLKVGPVDVASAERLPFRLSASLTYNIVNPRDFHERQGELLLRQTVTAALIELAGERTLEQLVANRAEASQALLALAAARATDCEVVRGFVDAVQLPPESRRLFIEIERARLEGLASLERARGEQATLRSLANAARMLKNNPDLMNLRLLQAVSASQKGQMTVVLGQNAVAGKSADGGGS